MTMPKGQKYKSEKRAYSYSTNTTRGKKPHSAITPEHIAALFRQVGWLGGR